METNIMQTMNRKLEQTLWALGVHHLSCDKNPDGMTVWTYPATEKVKMIFNWFREASERRERMW